jgi:hypothetical protein
MVVTSIVLVVSVEKFCAGFFIFHPVMVTFLTLRLMSARQLHYWSSLSHDVKITGELITMVLNDRTAMI